ncbi:RNA polymerase subunit RPO18, partial [Monkeypox virus]
IE